MAQMIEAAYLAGFEPSSDSMPAEELYKNDYLYNKGFRSLADRITLDVYR